MKRRTSQDAEDCGEGVEQLTPALRGGEPGPEAQLQRQQRAADEQQADVDQLQGQIQPHHGCRHGTRSAVSSPSPLYVIQRQTETLTLFRVGGQGVKPSTFLLCASQGRWESAVSSLTTTLRPMQVRFTQVFTWPEII